MEYKLNLNGTLSEKLQIFADLTGVPQEKVIENAVHAALDHLTAVFGGPRGETKPATSVTSVARHIPKKKAKAGSKKKAKGRQAAGLPEGVNIIDLVVDLLRDGVPRSTSRIVEDLAERGFQPNKMSLANALKRASKIGRFGVKVVSQRECVARSERSGQSVKYTMNLWGLENGTAKPQLVQRPTGETRTDKMPSDRRRLTVQCDNCNGWYPVYKGAYERHIKHCTGRLDFAHRYQHPEPTSAEIGAAIADEEEMNRYRAPHVIHRDGKKWLSAYAAAKSAGMSVSTIRLLGNTSYITTSRFAPRGTSSYLDYYLAEDVTREHMMKLVKEGALRDACEAKESLCAYCGESITKAQYYKHTKPCKAEYDALPQRDRDTIDEIVKEARVARTV